MILSPPRLLAISIACLLFLAVGGSQSVEPPTAAGGQFDAPPEGSFLDRYFSTSYSEAQAQTIWDTDSLLFCDLDSLQIDAEIGRPVRGPFRLPPRPNRNSIGLIFADGRPSRWDSLVVYGGSRYWRADQVCHAFDASLSWNPELMRGDLRIDSLYCGFVVGGEVMRCGGQARQLSAPVIYMNNQLLFPLDFAQGLTETSLSSSYHYRPDSVLLIQQPPAPPGPDLYIQQIGNRTYIKWPLPSEPEAEVSIDGAFGITVSIPGVFIDPENPPAPKARRGTCLWAIRPNAEGTDFTFRVGPAIKTWRLKWHTDRGELGLTLSANAGDMSYPTYFPWDQPAPPARSDSAAAVILIVPREQTGGEVSDFVNEAICCVRDTGEQIRRHLDEYGHPVDLIADTERSNLVPMLNGRGGRLCLILKPDLAGDRLFPGCRFVASPDRPGTRPFVQFDRSVSASGEDPGRTAANNRSGLIDLRPWRRIAPAHAGEVRELTWLLGQFLGDEYPNVPMRRQKWPIAYLEGLDMPALVVYVGDLKRGDYSFGDDSIDLPARFAELIALSVSTFIEREKLSDASR